jgi:hypothetical protein
MRFAVLILLVACGAASERRARDGQRCAIDERLLVDGGRGEEYIRAIPTPTTYECLRCEAQRDVLVDASTLPGAPEYRCMRRCTRNDQCDDTRCLGAWCDEPGRQPLSRSP